jgi:phosphoribosyl-ATP pyrophosphohydrolase
MTTELDRKTQSTTNFDLQSLYDVILDRKENPQDNSYTNQLFILGEDEIVKKIGEESIEIILAAKSQGRQRLIEETADLAYHVLVLLALKDITPMDIQLELRRRHS